MWHESRRQERLVHGYLVDHRKRAERRRQYYEKILQDPNQFLQVHGRRCKLHLQPTQGISEGLVPWPGDNLVLIDRFDGRAHLDHIAENRGESECDAEGLTATEADQLQFERYRILVQNQFQGVQEGRFLQQISLEEQLGSAAAQQPTSAAVAAASDKRRLQASRAAISYVYGDDKQADASSQNKTLPYADGNRENSSESTDEDQSQDATKDDDIDLDMCLDIEQLTTAQYGELNQIARSLGFSSTGFMDLLMCDRDEIDACRMTRLQEEEKQAISGKKRRKERRQLKELRLLQMPRDIDSLSSELPSYALQPSEPVRESRSRSVSPAPVARVEYITSFGQHDESDSDRDNQSPVNEMQLSIAHKGAKKSSLLSSRARRGSSGRRSPDKSHSRSKERYSARRRSRSIDSRRRRTRSRSRDAYSSSRRSRRSRSRGRDSRSAIGRNSYNRARRSRSNNRRWSARSRRSRSRDRSMRSRSRSRDHKSRSLRYRSRSRSSTRKKYSSARHRNSATERSDGTLSAKSKDELSSKTDSQRGKTAVVSAKDVPPNETSRLPSPPIRRYYGRCRSTSSSSIDSDLSSVAGGVSSADVAARSGTGSSNSSSSKAVPPPSTPGAKMTPQERLKLKMQLALKKQQRADKRNELSRVAKQEREQQQREADIRAQVDACRRRAYGDRHRRRSSSRSSSSDSSCSRSSDSRYRRRSSRGSSRSCEGRSRPDRRSGNVASESNGHRDPGAREHLDHRYQHDSRDRQIGDTAPSRLESCADDMYDGKRRRFDDASGRNDRLHGENNRSSKHIDSLRDSSAPSDHCRIPKLVDY